MEQQIRKLESELYNKPDDFQLSVVRRQVPVCKSFIKRSSHGEFLLAPQSVGSIFQEQASLEVLMAENSTSAMLGPDHDTAGHSTSVCQRTHQQTPERLRIRCAPLITTLERVCRETLSNDFLWVGDRAACASTIILRPWKFFVSYKKKIRDLIHSIDAFVEPARREGVSGEVAEIGLVRGYEYYPQKLVTVNLHAPLDLKSVAPLPVLISFRDFSRVQARRSAAGTGIAY